MSETAEPGNESEGRIMEIAYSLADSLDLKKYLSAKYIECCTNQVYSAIRRGSLLKGKGFETEIAGVDLSFIPAKVDGDLFYRVEFLSQDHKGETSHFKISDSDEFVVNHAIKMVLLLVFTCINEKLREVFQRIIDGEDTVHDYQTLRVIMGDDAVFRYFDDLRRREIYSENGPCISDLVFAISIMVIASPNLSLGTGVIALEFIDNVAKTVRSMMARLLMDIKFEIKLDYDLSSDWLESKFEIDVEKGLSMSRINMGSLIQNKKKIECRVISSGSLSDLLKSIVDFCSLVFMFMLKKD